MDTDELQKQPPETRGPPGVTDRFTRLMIFSSDCYFPAFAAKNRINYKQVIGCYEGVIEDSYVVNVHNTNAIVAGGMLKGQDNVLLLAPQDAVYGGLRDVFRVDVNDDGELACSGDIIGKWYKVTVAEALHSDAWTCYPGDNAWYMAKMDETDL